MKAIFRLLALAAAPALLASAAAAQSSMPETYARPMQIDAPSGPPIVFNLPTGEGPPRPAAEPAYMPAKTMAPRQDPGPWYIEGGVGGLNDGELAESVFGAHSTGMTGDVLLAFGLGREIISLSDDFKIELGLSINPRVSEGGVEIAAPATFVFDGFPWRDRLPTRLRLGFGPSLATRLTDQEKRLANGDASKFLVMFAPELELGLPTAPEWAGFFRVHNRNGLFGLIDDVDDGATYFVVGLRHRFGLDQFETLQ